MYLDSTNLRLLLDIVIGTVPLRESIHSLSAPQSQAVVTQQPSSAQPSNQLDGDKTGLRMSFFVLSAFTL